MKKLGVLFAVFLGLALFVYFYEIEGQEEREEAEKLEQSLFRLKRDEITGIEILRPEKDPIVLRKEGDQWFLEQPIETLADNSAVDSLLRNVEQAERERTFAEAGAEPEKYGLNDPRLTLKVRTEDGEKTALIGKDDFRGVSVYAKFPDDPQVFLTSDYLVTTADKDLMQWRSKKILAFERERAQGVEIVNPSGEIRLVKKDDTWFLASPMEEKADQSFVSSLLSSLEFAEAQEFVRETAGNLKSHGLDRPQVVVRVRQEGEEHWRTLELGKKKESHYFARNPDRSPVFTVREDVREKLVEKVWAFRDKEVLDVEQEEITRLVIRRGEEEIALKHEEFKWIVEKPESHQDKEALSYKFWYPFDDLKFDSIQEGKSRTAFPQPTVELVVTLKDGSQKNYQFAQKGNQYLARLVESGRQGTISKESFEKLQLKIEEIV